MLRSNGGPGSHPDVEWHGGAARRFFESAMWGHMSTTDLPGSSLLAGRYRLVERLGAGGMSVVWRGYDEVLGRPVAVKLLAAELVADPELRGRVRREARAAWQGHAPGREAGRVAGPRRRGAREATRGRPPVPPERHQRVRLRRARR